MGKPDNSLKVKGWLVFLKEVIQAIWTDHQCDVGCLLVCLLVCKVDAMPLKHCLNFFVLHFNIGMIVQQPTRQQQETSL